MNLYSNQNHDYYHQVQGQLYMTGTDLKVIRIIKNKNWASNIPKLIDFYFNIFIP